jgi:hypothetical protein
MVSMVEECARRAVGHGERACVHRARRRVEDRERGLMHARELPVFRVVGGGDRPVSLTGPSEFLPGWRGHDAVDAPTSCVECDESRFRAGVVEPVGELAQRRRRFDPERSEAGCDAGEHLVGEEAFERATQRHVITPLVADAWRVLEGPEVLDQSSHLDPRSHGAPSVPSTPQLRPFFCQLGRHGRAYGALGSRSSPEGRRSVDADRGTGWRPLRNISGVGTGQG